MGYLICEECGGYYELQKGESPENFDRCECGGELKYVESLDDIFEEPEFQADVKKSDVENYRTKNRKKFTKTTGGKVVIIMAALAILLCISLLPSILVGAGYFFLVHEPYQNGLSSAKQEKINEVNTYFAGPLATDPMAINLKNQINTATTPTEVMAMDVLTPATSAWRTYQLQQIKAYKGSSGTVRITYTAANGQKNAIMKVADAQRLITQLDATVLSSMVVTTP